jgi:hypothetical protein
MGDPAKKGGALKWVLIGCGCIVGLGVLGIGSCVGLAWFAASKMLEQPIAAGKAFIAAQPTVKEEFGDLTKVEHNFLAGTNVQINNGVGRGRVCFDVASAKGSGSAVVWMTYANDSWTAVGCTVTIGGKTIKVGKEVTVPTSGKFDD